MTVSMISAVMGSILIIVGIGLVIVQSRTIPMPGRTSGLDIGTRGVKLHTTYPGIILVGIGAFLLIVAQIRGR